MNFLKQFFNLSPVFMITAGITLVLAGCNKLAPPPQFGPVPVQVTTAKQVSLASSSEYLAVVKSRESVVLQPRAEGQVTRIFVRSGDTIRAGAPILQIDPLRQQAIVNSIQAGAGLAQADIASARAGLQTYQAQRKSIEADLEFNQKQFDRYNTLYAQKSVSLQELESYADRLKKSKADLATNDAQLSTQRASITHAQKSLQQNSANIQEQQTQLQYFGVRAPFSGTIGDIPVKVGSYVNTATVLTTITQNNPLEIYIAIAAEKASRLHNGATIRLVDSDGKSIGQCQVFFIASTVDPTTQTVLVKGLYDNSAGQLRADQQLRAQLVWDTHAGFAVPVTAVVRLSGQDFLYVTGPGRKNKKMTSALMVPVTLGDIIGQNYKVLSGIKAGDQIIISGTQKLRDDTPIAVKS